MTDTSVAPADTDSLPDPEKIISDFERLVVDTKPDGQKRPRGPLWYAWHYLQVYSYWGLGLPNTEDDLKLKLGIKDAASYPFFNPMVNANKIIHDASTRFLNEVFAKVVDLGDSMHKFAKDAASKGGNGTLAAIATLSSEDALALLGDLQSDAKNNADKAEDVTNKLAAYKTSLIDAQAKLVAVKSQIEADERTSQAKIDELNSSAPGATDSIAALRKKVQDEQETYKQDVIIATTTLTYCWVPVIGQVSSVVVAIVYGVRATQMLEDIDALQARIEAAEATLRTAIESHRVQDLAHTGASNAITHTDLAIAHATTVQNAWKGLCNELGTVMDKLSKTTSKTGDKQALASVPLLNRYLNAADEAWGALLPPLAELVADPYIKVDSGEFTVSEFSTQVQKALADQTKPGN